MSDKFDTDGAQVDIETATEIHNQTSGEASSPKSDRTNSPGTAFPASFRIISTIYILFIWKFVIDRLEQSLAQASKADICQFQQHFSKCW